MCSCITCCRLHIGYYVCLYVVFLLFLSLLIKCQVFNAHIYIKLRILFVLFGKGALMHLIGLSAICLIYGPRS